MAKKEKEYTNITTPIGLCSFPYLAKPDTGRKESSNKYSCEIYVPKTVWAKEGKPVVDAILKVAREFFDDPKIKSLAKFKNPITDMDTQKDVKDYQKGTIRIRAKASSSFSPGGKDQKPVVVGPRKDPETGKFPKLSDEEVAAIKGGDFVRLIGGVYGYSQQGGGIAIGLNFVQFAREGKAIGQGKMKQVEELEEIEVDVDSPEEMIDTESEEDSEEEVDESMKFG